MKWLTLLLYAVAILQASKWFRDSIFAKNHKKVGVCAVFVYDEISQLIHAL